MRDYVLQASVMLLIGCGVGIALAQRVPWGGDPWGWAPATACFTWSAAWALVLGCLGLRSMRQTLSCRPQQMLGVMMAGLLMRAGVLVASQLAVYFLYSPLWGKRTLLVTTVFYMVVLFVEVRHLHLMMNRKRPSDGADGGRENENSFSMTGEGKLGA